MTNWLRDTTPAYGVIGHQGRTLILGKRNPTGDIMVEFSVSASDFSLTTDAAALALEDLKKAFEELATYGRI